MIAILYALSYEIPQKVQILGVIILAHWFAWKNVDNMIIFNTLPFQVRSITSESNPIQSGSVFYEHAKLTDTLYKHIVIFTMDGRLTIRMPNFLTIRNI